MVYVVEGVFYWAKDMQRQLGAVSHLCAPARDIGCA